jgi:hypothetical protein
MELIEVGEILVHMCVCCLINRHDVHLRMIPRGRRELRYVRRDIVISAAERFRTLIQFPQVASPSLTSHHVFHPRASLAHICAMYTPPKPPRSLILTDTPPNVNSDDSNMSLTNMRMRLHASGPRYRPQDTTTQHNGRIR